MQKLIDFKGINFEDNKNESHVKNIRKKDIAIIGLSSMLGGARDTDALYRMLSFGEDSVKPFPKGRRKDVENYLNAIEANPDSIEYHNGAYMEEIDKFDYKFFSISLKEASLMDPNQRMFLETAWKAIEDAGYGGNKLEGMNVGIFLGYSSDFGEEYKKMVQVMDPASVKLSTTGNIKSIIASRISYLLDLHGPSMVIDTACSSSLVAIHEACRSIRSGDCETAIAGGVKVLMMPVKAESHSGAGIQILNDIASSDGKTRTFDNNSNGTLLGEGVAAVILKPLNRAMEDRDHIYAVIKGSAVNQDGSSIGITAPNSKAQEEVICAAWKDADIDPETISYIEAHGTGTKLGDTVEINGLEKAFRNYTDKMQFCAIGSIKTNIGHLDCTAGISGLTKAVLSLKKKKLFPSLNFTVPNRNIPIEKSPVFINDSFIDWNSKNIPRRCGISSFGLSGTNCHMILEEAPDTEEAISNQGLHIFTLSAKSESSLKGLVNSYIDYFNSDSISPIQEICYTANTGRGHYRYRLAMLVKSAEDLECKLAQIYSMDYQYGKIQDVCYGNYKVIYREKEVVAEDEITESEMKRFTEQVNTQISHLSLELMTAEQYRNLCSLYVRGANLSWESLYKGSNYSKISLPTYIFEQSRCWLPHNINTDQKRSEADCIIGPLIDSCLARTMNLVIYKTQFQVDRHWVLSEHKVFDKYVVPGTAYIEMIREALYKENKDQQLIMKDLKFIAPLALDKGEVRETHLIIKNQEDSIEYVITSKDELSGEWIIHVNGEASYDTGETEIILDLDEIELRFAAEEAILYKHSPESPVKTGDRWDTYQKIFKKTEEFLSYIQLKEEYHTDLSEYGLHPSMMDCAANTANTFIGNGFYLPFSYKKLKIFGSTPPSFYSYLRRKDNHNNDETAVFDVYFLDDSGTAFAKAEDYVIKKVRMDNIDVLKQNTSDRYHQVCWVKKDAEYHMEKIEAERILIFKNTAVIGDDVIQELKSMGKEIIEVSEGSDFKKISDGRYLVGSSQLDYDRLIQETGPDLPMILHMFSAGEIQETENLEQLEAGLNNGVYSLFYLTKALISNKMNRTQLYVISDYASYVSDSQGIIKPVNSTVIGLAKVIEKEYPEIICRAIDMDRFVTGKDLIREISLKDSPFIAAFREKIRYVEEFRTADFREESGRESIEEDGVYVITGGTGGLGLLTAQLIAAKKGVKIALFSRHSLPAREEWNHITDSRILHKINAVKSMEAKGAVIELYALDIINYEEVNAVLNDLRTKYGRITGVIHCAGIAGDGFLFRKEENVFRSVIEPKVKGTWVLEKLTKADKLHFFVMFSSIATVVHFPGQGDYTAANSFMDTFAYYMNGIGRKAMSIIWAPWKETGMAADYNVDMEKGAFLPITDTEGISALEKIMNSGDTGIIAGRLNENCFNLISEHYLIHESVSRSVQKKKPVRGSRNEKKNIEPHNVVITGKHQASLSETEIKVAAIWANFLCLDTIDIYDSFYSMGGDSVIATVLLKEMEKEFPEVLSITDVFTYPTVMDISEYIEKKTRKEDSIVETLSISKIVEMLSQNQISPEKADQMIKSIS